ncbi:DUF7311 family protein [Halomarina ordinaria]|uniref:DUF7311 domain-containing protein n=1 Tax=Halomarina ordinaria TaxID=3033939 RepID=A0ABD5U7K8_9EURY|nr:hypothetical protein [Halomarina sp. PSRA2]
MTLRVVLAVLLTVALVGVSLPAIDRAGVAASDAALDRRADGLATAAENVCLDSAPVAPGTPGARRSVPVTLPERSLARAGVERVRIDAGGVHWRVRGAPPDDRRFDVPVVVDADPLVLRGAGTHRLSLTCERRPDHPDGVAVLRRA